jgi:hypothetical protein
MKKNKLDYVGIGFAVVLLLIVFGIAAAATLQNNAINNAPTPTPPFIQPTRAMPNPVPLVPYDEEAEVRLIEKIRNRPKLSSTDAKSRETLLITTLKGYNSGVAFETTNVRVEYIKSLDLFMAEIKTINISQAKAEANIWLRSKNLSQQGICDLPIMFILSGHVSQALDNEDIIFSPLADGC